MSRVRIIAEAGVNHNGSLDIALRMVDAAAAAGADAVKFQTFQAGSLVTASAQKAGYQAENTGDAGSQLEMLQGLMLSLDDHTALLRRCRERGIEFLSTAFDQVSVDLLVTLGVTTFKVPSGALTDLPHLRRIGSLGGDVILSTGMGTLDEV
ncbi:MAG: N-acetylneuraminate synthase family protein, partial [Coriobacteriia bacterium]